MSEHRSQYWRSLEQLADTDEFREFLHREFPTAGSELPEEDGPDGLSRRRWMQLMGASLALSGAVGCRWPEDKIVPFVDRPENRVPGKAQKFASAWQVDGVGRSLLVTSYDGRPVKTSPNTKVPYTKGGTDVYDQALTLGLYDPDRASSCLEIADGEQQKRTWAEVGAMLGKVADTSGDGEGLAVLAEPNGSHILGALKAKFEVKFPKAQWVEFSSAAGSSERVALAQSDDVTLRPVYQLEKADIIVSFDADPLVSDFGSSALAAGWSSRRAPEQGDMNRLYAVESQFSGTGVAADHRLPVKSSEVSNVVAQIAALVKAGSAGEDPGAEASVLDRMIYAIASDLLAHKGKSALIAGKSQSPEVHKAVAALNETLGNVGQAVRYIETQNRPDDFEAISELIASMRDGRVKTLLVLGGNPVYSCPESLGLPAAFESVSTIIRVGLTVDETALASHWFLNETHPLEQWDVLTGVDETALSAQPLIAPLLDGQSLNSILAVLVGDLATFDDSPTYEREQHEAALTAAGAKNVAAAIEVGFVDGSANEPVNASFGEVELAETEAADGLELVLQPGEATYDGRFANNAWLQETPARVTKVCWDNVATINPNTAEELGIEQNTLVKVTANGQAVEVPAFLMPGQARGSIGLALGYGRTEGGRVASGDPERQYATWTFDQRWLNDGPVGVDVTPLRSAETPFVITGATVEPTGKAFPVATTQDHHAIDETGLQGIEDRVDDLIREGTLDEWKKHNDFAQHKVHHPKLESLWEEWDYEKRKWGMAIDLSKCVGCNACVTACQSENNIPVVGKSQIIKGREMHWVRLDRYFAFPKDADSSDHDPRPDLDHPRVVSQPVACHHCENAPCEQVCPVAATVHSAEGLNDMVYNRCIGTRYCANNCPYKVRRFNFFNYNKAYEYDGEEDGYDLQALVLNPDVTVRSRGVMEKCTYCVQRIKSVTQDARNDRRALEDGDIITACQEACPSNAITFGDVSQSDWEVSKQQNSPRAYAMLSELNVKPRTMYLARIRNPHPSLADLEPTAYKAEHLDHDGEGGHDEKHHDHDKPAEKPAAENSTTSVPQPRQPLVQLGSFIKSTLR